MEIIEGNMAFTFGDKWKGVLKFDEDSSYYRKTPVSNWNKAVDFMGYLSTVAGGEKVVLIEVKDFRTTRIENKKRFDDKYSDNLYDEIRQKVRDSIALAIGAAHNGHSRKDHPVYENIVRIIGLSQEKISVVIWIEEDAHTTGGEVLGNYSKEKKANTSFLLNKFKQKLAWLTNHVFLVRSSNMPPELGISTRFVQ